MGLMLVILVWRKDQESGRRQIRNRRTIKLCGSTSQSGMSGGSLRRTCPAVKPHPSLSFFARNINREKKKPKLSEIKVDSA